MAAGRREGATRSGRRRTLICPHWCRACSRRSATWPRRRSVSSPASVAGCCGSSRRSSVAGIMMAFGEGGARAIRSIFERSSPGPRRGVRRPVHGDHPRGRQGRARRRVHAGHHRRPLPARRRHTVGRRAGSHRPRARHRAGAGAARHAAGHRLPLVERQLRHRRGHPLHGPPGRRRHGRQRAEAVDARPRRRCADAGHPARRARRHGRGRHPRHVRRRARCSRSATRSSWDGSRRIPTRLEHIRKAERPGPTESMPAVQPRSAPTRALVLLAPVLLASCMLGPDFKRPVVPWLDGWSADALQSAEAESQAVGRPPVRHDEWWRNFDDPVLEELVEEAQRLNPGVRTAGMRILEARAQLGIAGSGLYPATAAGPRRGPVRRKGAERTARSPLLERRRRARRWLGAGPLGQVPPRHRVGGRRLFREHRAVRRSAGPGRGASRDLILHDSHHRTAAAHRARERRPAEAQPRDHRAPVPQRQRVRARRAAAAHALPEHARDDSRAREQPAPGAERARDSAGATAGAAARDGGADGSGFPRRNSASSRSFPPTCCAAGPTCARPSCRWPRSRR